ncbi:CBS domain-containing protein [Halostagnicola bangensis]
MPIENLARSDVVTATTDTAVQELATAMADENVGSIVICKDSKPVGIVTDRDLTLQVIGDGEHPDGITAEDVMSTDLCTVDHDDGFYRATELMSEHAVRRLPIVGSDGQLSGIITVDDLNELLANEHQQLAEVVQAQRPPY